MTFRKFAFWLPLVALGAVAPAASASIPTTTNPFTGVVAAKSYVVHGVVVHRIPLEGTFVLAGPHGGLLAINAPALPPYAHRVTVKVQRVGATVQELKLIRVGPRVTFVRLRGAVSFVSPRARRFVLSAGGASIRIHHRIRGTVPALYSDATVSARVSTAGVLVERRLLRGGHHSGLLEGVGTLLAVIPSTTDAVLTSTEELTSGCPSGCIVVSGDDQGGSQDPIAIALSPSGGIAAAARSGSTAATATAAAAPRTAPTAATASFSFFSFFASFLQQYLQDYYAYVNSGQHPQGGGNPIVTWNLVTNPASATAAAAPDAVCNSSTGLYALVKRGACPAGTTAGTASLTSLVPVQNSGGACATGLAFFGSSTEYVSGTGSCLEGAAGVDVASPVSVN